MAKLRLERKVLNLLFEVDDLKEICQDLQERIDLSVANEERHKNAMEKTNLEFGNMRTFYSLVTGMGINSSIKRSLIKERLTEMGVLNSGNEGDDSPIPKEFLDNYNASLTIQELFDLAKHITSFLGDTDDKQD